MQKSELLNALKKEALAISYLDLVLGKKYLEEEFKFVPDSYRKPWLDEIFRYFAENLYELIRIAEVEGEIDQDKYRKLMERLNKSPENEYEKAFLKVSRVVVPYLIFIAQKPVHSPNIIFPGGLRIKQIGNKYYCPAKEKQENPYSFCEFCVCEKLEEG
ncbi:MAG: DUF2115 family protein [Archaeoglobaceae archaeon]